MAEAYQIFFTPCCIAITVLHCNCVDVRLSMNRVERLASYFLSFTIMYTTTKEKCVCLSCHSMNVVTHHYPDTDGVYGEYIDFGECLDCGGYEIVWEDTPIWNEMVNRGLLHA